MSNEYEHRDPARWPVRLLKGWWGTLRTKSGHVTQDGDVEAENEPVLLAEWTFFTSQTGAGQVLLVDLLQWLRISASELYRYRIRVIPVVPSADVSRDLAIGFGATGAQQMVYLYGAGTIPVTRGAAPLVLWFHPWDGTQRYIFAEFLGLIGMALPGALVSAYRLPAAICHGA